MPLHDKDENRALDELAADLVPILVSPIETSKTSHSGSDSETDRHNLVVTYVPPGTEDGHDVAFGYMEVYIGDTRQTRRVELMRRVPKE